MKPLYEIATSYRAIFDSCVDEETGEIKDIALFDGVVGEFDGKAVAIASFIKNLEVEINGIKEAEKAMMKRRKSLESLLERRDNYLKDNMERCGISRVKHTYFHINLKQNRESVDDYDKAAIPDKFKKVEIIETIDKIAILKAIQSGEEVPGARLVRKMKVEIK
jgi:hypothetical protein